MRGFGQILDGAIFVTPFNSDSVQPEVTEFTHGFRNKYSQSPSLLAAQGYDAARVALRTFDYRFSDTVSFIARLESIQPFSSATGKLAVRRDGEISRRMSVMTLDDGRLAEIKFAGRHQAKAVFDGSESSSEDPVANNEVIRELSDVTSSTRGRLDDTELDDTEESGSWSVPKKRNSLRSADVEAAREAEGTILQQAPARSISGERVPVTDYGNNRSSMR